MVSAAANLETLVEQATGQDTDLAMRHKAFGEIVSRFQDMAFGCAFSSLGDYHLAQDAAQNAFVTAWRKLPALEEPTAFPGWFRKIVLSACRDLTRGKSASNVDMEVIAMKASEGLGPQEAAEQGELRAYVQDAIRALPERERAVVTLFYIGEYSREEVAGFLGVPEATVKKRLRSSRDRLRERMVSLVKDELRETRPSRNSEFEERVRQILEAARKGDQKRVERLVGAHPTLLGARDRFGTTPVAAALRGGHIELAEGLMEKGAPLDFFDAAATGQIERVRDLAAKDPRLIDSCSSAGFTALCLAAHFGFASIVSLLLDLGAKIDEKGTNPLGVTPLQSCLFARRPEIAKLLIERGANVNLQRTGQGMDREGWTALHYASAYGIKEIVELLLAHGADREIVDHEGKTPLDLAQANRHEEVACLLKRK
jgi:RNA polymerase sigma factor (sigma-70 family)